MSTTPGEQRQNNLPENEIRVSGKTNVFNAIERIEEVFKSFDHIIITGINTGISKVWLITEISKLKIGGLHQYNLLETITIDAKEDSKDDKDHEESPKYLTRFKVEWWKTKPATAPKGFYQVPYTEEEIKKISEVKPRERGDDHEGGFRGRGRGGFRGRGRGRGNDGERGGYGERDGFRGRGRGEGRGRGGRGNGSRGGFRGGDRGGFRGGDREGFRGIGDGNRGRGRGGDRGDGRGRGRGRGNGENTQSERSQQQERNQIPGLGKGQKTGLNN